MKSLSSLVLTVIFIGCELLALQGCQQTSGEENVQSLFAAQCASCHLGNGARTAPSVVHLQSMTPRSIVSALETGKMQIQGQLLDKGQKIAIAEMLTSKPYKEGGSLPPNICESQDIGLSRVKYAGWGGDIEGTGYIPTSVAQLAKEKIPHLKLKWAFGFEDGTVTRTKPAVIDESIIFGSQYGEVYCLDLHTGCVRWMFAADGTIRGGIAVSEDIGDELIVYFADFNCTTYALSAKTGELRWKENVRTEASNAVTGTVAYHEGMVYIPLTSMEVTLGTHEAYECCKGSGMVVALNAADGEEVWRHRVIADSATRQGESEKGVMKFGPSGSPVWSSPTVDAKRGFLYIGTGENNSYPTTDNSDALQALDLKTGELVWNYQATGGDAYVIGEFYEGGTAMKPCAGCPDPSGPDVDFGMAPILNTRTDGSEVLIVGQKSGVVHCLDPDTGQPVWQTRIGRGGALGGIHWGIATDGKVAYVSNSDWFPYGSDPEFPASPGLFALDMMTGEVLWKASADPTLCQGIAGCYSGFSAAPTLINGAVFAGNLDGYARAYDADRGELLWEFDTKREFETVNQITASGGAIDGPGPVVAGGMVLFNSGYGMHSQKPGNVLLAFEAGTGEGE
jgi:polyvinyl alcohol dehydrogenase (cytochrome)